MAQRLGSLDDWNRLKDGQLVTFKSDEAERAVSIDTNSAQETSLFVTDLGTGEERFLALVKGRDRVEFTVAGDYELACEGGDVFYKSSDEVLEANREVDPVIFTRVANRKQRNPNLEMIEFKMKQNQLAFQAKMEAELERRSQDLERRYVSQRDIRAPAELVGGDTANGPEKVGERDVTPEGASEGGGAGSKSGSVSKPKKPASGVKDDE